MKSLGGSDKEVGRVRKRQKRKKESDVTYMLQICFLELQRSNRSLLIQLIQHDLPRILLSLIAVLYTVQPAPIHGIIQREQVSTTDIPQGRLVRSDSLQVDGPHGQGTRLHGLGTGKGLCTIGHGCL